MNTHILSYHQVDRSRLTRLTRQTTPSFLRKARAKIRDGWVAHAKGPSGNFRERGVENCYRKVVGADSSLNRRLDVVQRLRLMFSKTGVIEQLIHSRFYLPRISRISTD